MLVPFVVVAVPQDRSDKAGGYAAAVMANTAADGGLVRAGH
jgi:hypothetical protein